jgi:hypothetical protein
MDREFDQKSKGDCQMNRLLEWLRDTGRWIRQLILPGPYSPALVPIPLDSTPIDFSPKDGNWTITLRISDRQ